MSTGFSPKPKMFRCKVCGAINRVANSSNNGHAVVCGRCKRGLDLSGAPQDVDGAALAHALQSSPIPVLVGFWAPRRQPFGTPAPLFDEIAREHAGRVITLMLDMEQEPAPAIVHGVHGRPNGHRLSVPTFILFRAGQEVARRSGTDRPALGEWLHSAA